MVLGVEGSRRIGSPRGEANPERSGVSNSKRWLAEQSQLAADAEWIEMRQAQAEGFSPSAWLEVNYQIPLGSDLKDLDYDRLRSIRSQIYVAIRALRARRDSAVVDLEEQQRVLVTKQIQIRRRQVENALAFVETEFQMDEIQGAVESKVADEDARREISDLIAQLKDQQLERAADRQAADEGLSRELRRVDISARKWQIRKSMLEKEPAAVLVGGVLLAPNGRAHRCDVLPHRGTGDRGEWLPADLGILLRAKQLARRFVGRRELTRG